MRSIFTAGCEPKAITLRASHKNLYNLWQFNFFMIDFDKLIENHLARENKPKQIGRYYPSEVGSCLRKVWYSYKFPQPTSPELLKVFEVGNIVHEFIANVMRSEKNPHVQLLESELPFKIEMNGLTVSGRIDDLLLVKASGKKLMVEVKSTAHLESSNEAQPHHLMQLQLYMHQMKIEDGAVLYVEKNTLKTKAFYVKYDEGIAAEALNRFNILHKHLNENKTPAPEARVRWKEMGWMCTRCEFRDKCFSETPDKELPPAQNGNGKSLL